MSWSFLPRPRSHAFTQGSEEKKLNRRQHRKQRWDLQTLMLTLTQTLRDFRDLSADPLCSAKVGPIWDRFVEPYATYIETYVFPRNDDLNWISTFA
jgi:hypothetical protein